MLTKLAKALRAAADVLESETEEKSVVSVKELKGKPTSRVPVKEEVVDFADDNEEDTEEKETVENEDDDLDLDEEEAPKKVAKPAKTLSLEKDIIPAFRAYKDEHSLKEAKKVLARFKVENVHDLKPALYKDVLKVLNS